MNQLKNKLLMFIALSSITTNLIPHGSGGSGFGAGLAGGMLGGALISGINRGGGDRSPEYYEYRRETANQARYDALNRKLDRLEKRLEKSKDPKSQARIQKQIDRTQQELDTL